MTQGPLRGGKKGLNTSSTYNQELPFPSSMQKRKKLKGRGEREEGKCQELNYSQHWKKRSRRHSGWHKEGRLPIRKGTAFQKVQGAAAGTTLESPIP